MALPTISIKGKEYTLVKDRVLFFNESYPNGCISTKLISAPDDARVVVEATVVPDVYKPTRVFRDYSQAVVGDGMINKQAALENASTSAVGRALALMGIGIIDSVASADEIKKATPVKGVPVSLPPNVVVKLKATDFPFGANAPLEDDVLPPEMYEDSSVGVLDSGLSPDARATAIEMENFKPLSQARNTEIQARLKELVSNKTLDRKKLALFLDREHNGKKSIDVHADTWESTMKKIEDAVSAGGDAVKNLLKGN